MRSDVNVVIVSILILVVSSLSATTIRFNCGEANENQTSVAWTARIFGVESQVIRDASCGADLDLATGSYDAFVYGKGLVGDVERIVVTRQSVRTVFALRLPTAPAGELLVPVGARRVRIFASANLFDGHRRPMFEAECGIAGFSGACVVPAGDALVLSVDQNGVPVGVAGPVHVDANAKVKVEPAGFSATALVAKLDVPVRRELGNNERTVARLNEIAADSVLASSDGIVAVWAGSAKATSTLRVFTPSFVLPPTDVRAFSGIRLVEKTLLARPSLSVLVRAAEGARLPQMMLGLECAETNERVERPVEIGLNHIENIPVGLVTASLNFDPWIFQKRVDTSAGNNESISFELHPALLRGTVFYGDDPAPANLLLRGPGTLRISTEDDGTFLATVWALSRYTMEVTLRERNDVPVFTDNVRIDGDRSLVIRIPRSKLVVTVTDSKSGRPVPKASLVVKNSWHDAVEGDRSVMVRVAGNDSGETTLPPMRPGTVTIFAEAPGYRTASPVTENILEDTSKSVRLSLEPASGSVIRLALASGVSAAGAFVIGFVGDNIAWSATSADDGTVTVPDNFRGKIGVRHPVAATDVRDWGPEQGFDAWQLGEPAPPLTVRVSDRGGAAVSGATVCIVLRGVRLAGAPLSVLTQGPRTTIGQGLWPSRNLPREPLTIIVAVNANPALLLTGAYDAFSSTVPFPWPTLASVAAADQ